MKTLCYALLIIVVLAFAGSVSAQGYIGLFSDPGYSSSNLYDNGVNLATIYVGQNAEGFIASRWKLELDPRLDFTILGIEYHLAHAGDLFSGVVFDYGSCMSGFVLIATVNALTSGTSPTCSWIDIVADPASRTGSVEVIDCDGYKLIVHCNDDYREMMVNPDGSCMDGGPG